MRIETSELLINDDNSVYHLCLKPSQMVSNIIVVGDIKRVDKVASFFDTIIHREHNREYKSIVGSYQGKDIMVISSGIGCGAIDILINELDALVNVDFETREIKKQHTELNIVRLGTTGVVCSDIDLGDVIMSRYTIGIDALAHFYPQSEMYRDEELECKFRKDIFENSKYVIPYAIESSSALVKKFESISKQGITMCAGGFFAPQGRRVRLNPAFESMLDNLTDFSYNGVKFTNIEMEGAALETLAITLGHKAVTLCVAVAHRTKQAVNTDYENHIDNMIKNVLEKI